eukprot:CAMPEP_0118958666 /NCGR_PEP_ID=MMETSP1169-20130426/62742_1 /TAXON_ID=36882 /ORGANISM="Pyramimonas obovata, Strain CCMP722" /LENGTH=276 /DNA_ID=CAMNT_0006906791 /DNA_START=288 /DNA_END=1119 /DNA_ORIENTATION=-
MSTCPDRGASSDRASPDSLTSSFETRHHRLQLAQQPGGVQLGRVEVLGAADGIAAASAPPHAEAAAAEVAAAVVLYSVLRALQEEDAQQGALALGVPSGCDTSAVGVDVRSDSRSDSRSDKPAVARRTKGVAAFAAAAASAAGAASAAAAASAAGAASSAAAASAGNPEGPGGGSVRATGSGELLGNGRCRSSGAEGQREGQHTAGAPVADGLYAVLLRAHNSRRLNLDRRLEGALWGELDEARAFYAVGILDAHGRRINLRLRWPEVGRSLLRHD